MQLKTAGSDVQHVLDDLRRIVRVLRESSRAAEAAVGLTGAQLFVLQALEGEPELSMNELAARTRTHQSSVSTVVARLVARRLVKRVAAKEDARRVSLSLTASGRALLRRAPGAAQERLIEGLERMAPRGRRALAALLGELVDAIQVRGEEPVMFFEESPKKKRSRSRRG